MKPAGGIRTAKQAIQYLVRAPRDARRRVADARPLPVRRLVAPQRPPHPASQAEAPASTGRPTSSRSTDGRRREAARRGRRARVVGLRARRPRRATSSRSSERYGLFIGGEQRLAATRSWFTTISPSTEEPLAEVAQAGAKDVALAVGAARDAFRTAGADASRPSARRYLFRIARVLQERAREFAVAESLDGGKPIKESRDVDLPLAAAHFFYYAGWADKLEYAFPGRKPRRSASPAQIVPWNFPLLMLSWKIAPALACREHRRAQAGRDDAADGAPLRRRPAARPSCRPASSTSSRATARPARRSSKHPGVDKVAFTGSTEVGKAIQRELAGHRQAADARARRQGGEHRLRRLRARPGGRGDRQRHLLQPGPRVLRGLAAARAGVDLRAARREAQAPPDDAARRRPARQEHRRRRDQLERSSSSKITELVAGGEDEGAEIYQPPCRLPEKGYWFAPTVFTNVAQSYRIAQEEIFGPVLSRAHVPHARRGGREGEQHAVRALRGRLDGEGIADPLDGPAAARGRRLGEHVQPLRSGVAVRRLQGVRASAARAGATGSSRT